MVKSKSNISELVKNCDKVNHSIKQYLHHMHANQYISELKSQKYQLRLQLNGQRLLILLRSHFQNFQLLINERIQSQEFKLHFISAKHLYDLFHNRSIYQVDLDRGLIVFYMPNGEGGEQIVKIEMISKSYIFDAQWIHLGNEVTQRKLQGSHLQNLLILRHIFSLKLDRMRELTIKNCPVHSIEGLSRANFLLLEDVNLKNSGLCSIKPLKKCNWPFLRSLTFGFNFIPCGDSMTEMKVDNLTKLGIDFYYSETEKQKQLSHILWVAKMKTPSLQVLHLISSQEDIQYRLTSYHFEQKMRNKYLTLQIYPNYE